MILYKKLMMPMLLRPDPYCNGIEEFIEGEENTWYDESDKDMLSEKYAYINKGSEHLIFKEKYVAVCDVSLY